MGILKIANSTPPKEREGDSYSYAKPKPTDAQLPMGVLKIANPKPPKEGKETAIRAVAATYAKPQPTDAQLPMGVWKIANPKPPKEEGRRGYYLN